MTNLIKTTLTPAQILNQNLNGGYNLKYIAKAIENFCPTIHLTKLETDQDAQSPNSYQLGALEYITPYIEEIITKTNIADYAWLTAIATHERDYEGTHIWSFALKTSNLIDYEPSIIDDLTNTFKEIFTYDSEACFNHAPQIHYLNGLFIILVPFTC